MRVEIFFSLYQLQSQSFCQIQAGHWVSKSFILYSRNWPGSESQEIVFTQTNESRTLQEQGCQLLLYLNFCWKVFSATVCCSSPGQTSPTPAMSYFSHWSNNKCLADEAEDYLHLVVWISSAEVLNNGIYILCYCTLNFHVSLL